MKSPEIATHNCALNKPQIDFYRFTGSFQNRALLVLLAIIIARAPKMNPRKRTNEAFCCHQIIREMINSLDFGLLALLARNSVAQVSSKQDEPACIGAI